MSSIALALAVAVCGATPAQGEFGRRGDIIVSVDRLVPFLDYQSDEITSKGTGPVVGDFTRTESTSESSFSFLWGGSSGLTSGWFNTPRIGVDYVVADRITVGGDLAYFANFGAESETKTETAAQTETVKEDLPEVSGFGIALRGGYVLSLGKGLSFWPRAGLSYYSASQKLETPAAGGLPASTTETSVSQTALNLEALATYSPVRNVIITAGPVLDVPIDGTIEDSFKTSTTTTTTKADSSSFHIGLTLGLAFYF